MTPELSRRIAVAMNKGNPTLNERIAIIKAAQTATSFRKLPDEIQELIEELEGRPPL